MKLLTLDKNPQARPLFKEGVLLLVDKPKHWTSFDVVNKLRYHISKLEKVKRLKVGHAGTLDPLATGLLLICTGKYTKQIEHLQNKEKSYAGQISLGGTTPSYDMETEVDEHFSIDHITEDMIHDASKQFVGNIMQRPPIFSALKKDGERLYMKARRGEEVEIKLREVNVSAFEITNIDMPNVNFRVHCSKGTYIRSLAYDMGVALNSGAYLSDLVRESIGDYHLEDAWNLHDLLAYIDGLHP